MVKFGEIDENGNVVHTKEIKQSEMTSECWLIQFQGIEACKDCELLDTEECGGKEILSKLKNSKGFSLPLGD